MGTKYAGMLTLTHKRVYFFHASPQLDTITRVGLALLSNTQLANREIEDENSINLSFRSNVGQSKLNRLEEALRNNRSFDSQAMAVSIVMRMVLSIFFRVLTEEMKGGRKSETVQGIEQDMVS